MKTQHHYHSAAWVTTVLALSAIILTTRPQVAIAAEETKPHDKGFIEKMERWQDKMSEKFRDTWKGLRGDATDKSVATASVDLREDKDHYTVRLNLPDRDLDKVEIRLEGDTLRIVAPPGDKASRYEQTVALENIAPMAAPKIERKQKDSMIVVTVAKKITAKEDKVASKPAESAPSLLSDWDREIFGRMDKMRRDMDRMFEDAFREFRTGPDYQGFFDEPRFGSSVDLKEEGGAYVVRAYLPERDLQNINVSVEDRILKIEAKEQTLPKQEGGAGTLHTTRKAAYSQLITLPGPVQTGKMKVDRKASLLIVTLPKST